MSAGTVRQLGVNHFIWVKVASAWQLIGCANKYSIKNPVDIKKYMCQADGNASQKVPGERNATASLSGVVKDYSSGDEATNWSYNDWLTARNSGTELEFFVGANTTTGTIGKTFKGVISDLSEEHEVSNFSTWDVSIDVSGDVTSLTIPA